MKNQIKHACKQLDTNMNRSIRKDKEIDAELERFRMIDSPSEIYV